MGYNSWTKIAFPKSAEMSQNDESVRFWKCVLYAQGLPFVICSITAIVDSLKPQDECLYFPNMGVFRCFFGDKLSEPRRSYFVSARFLYFDIFLLLVQLANIFFICSILFVLNKGWRTQTQTNNISFGFFEEESLPQTLSAPDARKFKDRYTKRKQQAFSVIRLFVILGLPWLCELLSAFLETEYGYEKTKEVTFVADLFTLFSGFLIFLTLVVRKYFMRNLKSQYSGVRIARRGGVKKVFELKGWSQASANPEDSTNSNQTNPKDNTNGIGNTSL